MEKLNLDRHSLKKFGLTMGTAFLAITLFILLRHKYSPLVTAVISGIFFILAFMLPALLRPIYISWMRLAFMLAWINTRLILLIIFYIVFAPIGLALRLFGVDLLNKKIDKNKQSYWLRKEKKEFSPSDYEKQF